MTDSSKQKMSRHPSNTHLRGCNSNSITNIWSKKSHTPGKEPGAASAMHLSATWNAQSFNTFNNSNKNLLRHTPKKRTQPGQQHIAQDKNNCPEEPQRIILSKLELIEFTKKFAIDKIDYQQKIENLSQQLNDKTKRVTVLEQQVHELRIQEDYLMKVMEQLRDRHLNQIQVLNNKCQLQCKDKDKEIEYLGKQITKIRQWLEQQKIQTRRCMEFLKIKDQIIHNLEWQVVKWKNQLKTTKDNMNSTSNLTSTLTSFAKNLNYGLDANLQQQNEPKSYTSTAIKLNEGQPTDRNRMNSNSSKKVILRKQKKQQHLNQLRSNKQNGCEFPVSLGTQFVKNNTNIMNAVPYNTRTGCSQKQQQLLIASLKQQKIKLQNEKTQIFSKYRQLSIQNECLRKMLYQVDKIKAQKKHQINKISSQNQSSLQKLVKQTKTQKQNLLATKCQFLQRQVGRLAYEISRVESCSMSSNINENSSNSSAYQSELDYNSRNFRFYQQISNGKDNLQIEEYSNIMDFYQENSEQVENENIPIL